MVDGITSQGFRILSNSLATSYITGPLLETMGLQGCSSCVSLLAYTGLVNWLQ